MLGLIFRTVVAQFIIVYIILGFDAGVMAAVRHVEVKTDYMYYDVIGSTAAELYAQMNEQYAWAYVWLLPDVSGDCVCKTKCKFRLDYFTLYATIILPRWDPPRDSTQTLRATWRNLVAVMKKEEITHRNVAHGVMKKIRRDITFLHSKKSCTTVRRSLEILFRKRNYGDKMESRQGQIHEGTKYRISINPPKLKD